MSGTYVLDVAPFMRDEVRDANDDAQCAALREEHHVHTSAPGTRTQFGKTFFSAGLYRTRR
jgi:hypothetical protein